MHCLRPETMQKREPYCSPMMGKDSQETGSLQADIRRCWYWIPNDEIYVREKTAAAPEGQWVLPEE